MVFSSFFSVSFFLGSSLYNLYSHTNWNICCGKNKAAIKYSCGLQKERLESWMSFILGDTSMPYCWAAKSMRKESGAAQLAVDCVMPMLRIGNEKKTRRMAWSVKLPLMALELGGTGGTRGDEVIGMSLASQSDDVNDDAALRKRARRNTPNFPM